MIPVSSTHTIIHTFNLHENLNYCNNLKDKPGIRPASIHVHVIAYVYLLKLQQLRI